MHSCIFTIQISYEISHLFNCSDFQLILGGPFLPHIDCILRERASVMSSPIVSASDAGIRTAVKGISTFKGRPSQSCDLIIQLDRDFQLVCCPSITFGNNL